jgi:peptidyl-prolyl cis-trans isomerase C
MKRITKSLVLLCAAAPLMMASAPGQTNVSPSVRPRANPTDLFTNDIIAKGKGVSVNRAQLDEAINGLTAGAAANGQSIPPDRMAMLEQQILQRLIQVQLLTDKATDADKAAGKEMAFKRIEEIKTRAGSDDALDRQLKLAGMTRADFLSKVTEESVAETVLKREMNVNVTDADAKKFYDDNPAKFEVPEAIRVSHILVLTQDPTGAPLPEAQKAAKHKQLEDILKRARAGEDFAKLAKQYSEDPGSKDKGGEYTFGRSQMPPEFETAAFALNTNQISDIVTTAYGYHIVKLLEKIPAHKTGFDKVKTEIKDYLEAQAMQKQVPDYMKKIEKEAEVQILDDKLKPPPEIDSPATAIPPTPKAGGK